MPLATAAQGAGLRERHDLLATSTRLDVFTEELSAGDAEQLTLVDDVPLGIRQLPTGSNGERVLPAGDPP